MFLTACNEEQIKVTVQNRLADPPPGVVADLRKRCLVLHDQATCQWAEGLARFYMKQDRLK
jgi:hypothetical protein